MKYIDEIIHKYIILGYFEKNKDKFIKLGYEKTLAWVRIRIIFLSLFIIIPLNIFILVGGNMTPQEAPPEALPVPDNAVVWSPITKKWYDYKGYQL